jgi:DNA (cytosine-5)-methyltransferase 1
MLTFGAIAAKYRPQWLVWENVPGVLSSNGGRDFGSFLGMLGQLGYGFAYRVLDAQYFGVAQRRRRVFVVGCLGDWRSAAAVLFERHSLQGHPAPSRQAREVSTAAVVGSTDSGGEAVDCFNGVMSGDTACTLTAGGVTKMYSPSVMIPAQDPAYPLASCPGAYASYGDSQFNYAVSVPAVAYGWSEELNVLKDLQPTIQRGGEGGRHEGVAVAFHVDAQPDQMNFSEHTTATLTKSQHAGVAQHMQVRRLTPTECERLQGFPDDYTLVPNRGKPAADGPRYKALGNSWAVPNVRWIGRRIDEVAAIKNQQMEIAA